MANETTKQQAERRVDTWGAVPTLELPALTQEQCNAHMMALVSKRSAR